MRVAEAEELARAIRANLPVIQLTLDDLANDTVCRVVIELMTHVGNDLHAGNHKINPNKLLRIIDCGLAHRTHYDDETARMVDAYQDGASLAEVGRRHGISFQAVAQRLEQAGVQRRPRGRPRKKVS